MTESQSEHEPDGYCRACGAVLHREGQQADATCLACGREFNWLETSSWRHNYWATRAAGRWIGGAALAVALFFVVSALREPSLRWLAAYLVCAAALGRVALAYFR